MRFAHYYNVYWFWLILGLIVFFIWELRARRKIMSRFADNVLLKEIAASVSLKKKRIKSGLLIMVFIFGILALMRPQWGFQWHEVKRKGLDILIAMDTSNSMLASDVLPNRLERSKLAVKDLIKKLKGDRIGLVAFSGTAFLQCPLTVDYSGFLLALEDLNVSTIPHGGTSISSAIQTALKSYEAGAGKYKVLIIITDGEDHEGNPVARAQLAKKEGVKIFCIGIGTSDGELIRVTDEKGRKVFLKDSQGNVVKSRLNEDILKEIALGTDGSYVRSSGAEFGLDYIYEEKLASMERRDIKSQMNKFYYERFQIPLAVGLLFLLAEIFIVDRKKR